MTKPFKLLKQSKKSKARAGELKTVHGKIKTPFFMTIATRGAVKTLDTQDMEKLGAQILLSNTYHLFVRPGADIIKKAGGLHNFINWDKPILTDSGGYQVYSLAARKNKQDLDYDVRITESGAEFIDSPSGRKDMFTPERVVEIQQEMGVDLAMVLDVCSPYGVTKKDAKNAMELTSAWAKRSKQVHSKNLLFGIVQGSVFEDLRKKSAREITALDFDGYAIGGVAVVGESWADQARVLKWVEPLLPKDKPRYLMGSGKPEELVRAVKQGMDMFDCVLPTRNARHGSLYVRKGIFSVLRETGFYQVMQITNKKFEKDFKAVDAHCTCFTCANHTRAYLRHLFKVNEPLAARLATIHNVKFYLDLMQQIRQAIMEGKF